MLSFGATIKKSLLDGTDIKGRASAADVTTLNLNYLTNLSDL
jgi:hypothetical protein